MNKTRSFTWGGSTSLRSYPLNLNWIMPAEGDCKKDVIIHELMMERLSPAGDSLFSFSGKNPGACVQGSEIRINAHGIYPGCRKAGRSRECFYLNGE